VGQEAADSRTNSRGGNEKSGRQTKDTDCRIERQAVGSAAIIHTVKKLSIFPSPTRMSLTKLSLGGNDLCNYSGQGELVSDLPAGDGEIPNLFFIILKSL
jgi:hypothetical protein